MIAVEHTITDDFDELDVVTNKFVCIIITGKFVSLHLFPSSKGVIANSVLNHK